MSVTFPNHEHARMQTRTHFAILSALATEKQEPPIGLLSALCCLVFALLTATQKRKCANTAVLAADPRAAGLGRV